MADLIERHILDQLAENGRMRTKDIVATMPDEERKIKTRLSDMTKDGRITSPKRGSYIIASTTETQLNNARKNLHRDARSAENNEQTINKLLNTYDEVLMLFQSWVLQNITDKIDFEQQLIFIENFKWLTMIADKLMKRWALVHVGYDTNSRQAQEDAKAKTEARQKRVLEDAPIEDKIVVVAHYQEGMQEILRNLPRKELEDSKV